jgi:chromosome partitioning protein
VLIPVSADYLALKGVEQCEKTLRALEHVLKKRVERRYLITRFDTRRKLSHQIADELQGRFGADICRARISENVSLAESPSVRKDVFAHAPDSKGAKDYDALVDELLATGFIEVRPHPGQ